MNYIYTMHILCPKPWYIFTLLGFILTLNPHNAYSQCNCDHTINPNTVYINGNDPDFQFAPGDIVCLQGGNKAELWILNVHGTPEKPIIFRNCSGQLTIQQPNTHSYVLKISDSDHLRITGTGNPSHEYGIKIVGEGVVGSGSGIVLEGVYTNIELDHIEISNNEFAGIWAKEMDFSCEFNRDNFTLENLRIHDNYFHDIGAEAIYIIRERAPFSSTWLNCDTITVRPYGMKGTRIFNNIIERTGWDAMEVHAAYEDCEIYGNIISNYGLAGDPGQQKGIFLGDGTSGKCYNNILSNGAGDGIVAAGWSDNLIFNNIIDQTGRRGIYCHDRHETNPGTYAILNNTIINTGFDGIELNSKFTENFIFNNIIINPSNIEFITLGSEVSANIEGNYLDMNIENVRFEDISSSNYQLADDSPLINQGVDVSAYGVDFDLTNEGPSGISRDIGAYEFRGIPATPVSPIHPMPPSYNAQSSGSIIPYSGLFRYGSNAGFYPGWTDEQLADIAAGNSSLGIDGFGARTFRPSLPEHLVEKFGYKVRINTFEHYQSLGMDDHTLFIGFPADSNGHRDPNTYCDAGGQSWLFDNLYAPIWDNGEGGTPVNEDNYYAHYVWKLVYLYKDYVKFWQIINEPDFDGGGSGWFPPASEDPTFADVNWWDQDPDPCVLGNMRAPVQHYIRMLRISYEVIKSLAPEDYVVLGGIAYESFLDAILRNTDNPGAYNPEGIGEAGSVDESLYPHRGGAYFDVVTYHLYPQFANTVRYFTTTNFVYQRHSDAAVDAISKMKDDLQKVLHTRGFDGITYPEKHFSITEINIPRKSFPYTDPGSAGENFIGGDEVQRNFIIKAFVQAQINDLKQMYIYNLADDATFEEAANGFDLMGMYKKLAGPYSQEMNSSGVAFKTISSQLFGYRYDPTRTSALNLPDSIGGGAFINDAGIYKYVLWARTKYDQSEFTEAVFSFPDSFDYDEYGLIAYPWDHTINPNASIISQDNIILGGAPQFFEKSNGSTLPIELLKFEANVIQERVQLLWTTAWERSNNFFLVENSTNGYDFKAIGQIYSKGDSEQIQHYETYDHSPKLGHNYYRLKQIDLNGQFSYSPIVEVNIQMPNEINVYPVPVKQGNQLNIHVESKNNQLIRVRLLNLMGQELINLQDHAKRGEHVIRLNTSSLSKGLYQLLIEGNSDNNSKAFSRKQILIN